MVVNAYSDAQTQHIDHSMQLMNSMNLSKLNLRLKKTFWVGIQTLVPWYIEQYLQTVDAENQKEKKYC